MADERDPSNEPSTSEAAGASSSSAITSTSTGAAAVQAAVQQRSIASLLEAMALAAPARQSNKKEPKAKYAFWETQPVVQFSGADTVRAGGQESGVVVARVALAHNAADVADALLHTYCFCTNLCCACSRGKMGP